MTTEFQRTLFPQVEKVSATFPCLLVTGPRQVGKTTLLKSCCESSRRYISFDDLQMRHLAKSDPQLFFQTYAPPLLLDEVQYVPEIFPFIKMICDERGGNGLFWLTGSQQFSMMANITESLAGRVGILNLQGFSQAEIESRSAQNPFKPDANFTVPAEGTLDAVAIFERIFRGSFPALYKNPETDSQIFYSSYLQTYVERDVRSILNVANLKIFVDCMQLLAARTGQLLNFNEIARELGISVNTVKKWVGVLESSGIIFLLHPWSNNLTSRTIKTPKIYFFDTGLCAHLMGWESASALANGMAVGAIFETFVISEIAKSYIHNGKRAPIYFYRDKDGREIDLLLEYNQTLFPIEIKRSANPELSMARHFSALKTVGTPIGRGTIICLYPQFLPLSREVLSVPVNVI